MKNIPNLIFSKKFLKAIDESVARAVAESEAAGLPRSYLYSYDELPVSLAQLQGHSKPAEYPNVLLGKLIGQGQA